jgi:hypothetical protein
MSGFELVVELPSASHLGYALQTSTSAGPTPVPVSKELDGRVEKKSTEATHTTVTCAL